MKTVICINNNFSKRIHKNELYQVTESEYRSDFYLVSRNGEDIGSYPKDLFANPSDIKEVKLSDFTHEELLNEISRRLEWI